MEAAKKTVSIMCFHDEPCQVFNAMMTALSLLRQGAKVTVYFGSRGVNALHKDRVGKLQCLPDMPEVGAAVTSSLSDLSDRSEPGGRARTVFHDFEAHSGPMQREIGENELASFGASQKWTALPTGAVDQPQVRQAARRMDEMDLPLVEDLFFMFVAEGGEVLACPLNVPLFGMSERDLIDGAKLADPARYYKEVVMAADMNLTF